MNWFYTKVGESNLTDSNLGDFPSNKPPTFKTLKYLNLMALINLRWMAEFFTKLSPVTLKKPTCFLKVLNNFIKKALELNNGLNTKHSIQVLGCGTK